MATRREIERFFNTYGDSDPNAMPDMYHEEMPSTLSTEVPMDEYGEKTNPLGRSMDRALRRFFGLDNLAPSPAENMVRLDDEPEYDEDVSDILETAYDEGNPPTLQKVTKETLSPIRKNETLTRKELSPEFLRKLARVLAT